MTRILAVTTLTLGVTGVASAHDGRGYFEIRSGSGQTNPAPKMVIKDDGNTLSYYSRGRDLDHSSQGRYLGIGKYTVESSNAYAGQLAEIRHVLSKRDAAVRDAVNAGPVLSYSFDMDGHHYEGAFNYQAEKPETGLLPVVELTEDQCGLRYPESLDRKHYSQRTPNHTPCRPNPISSRHSSAAGRSTTGSCG
ncbi:hypothetical protein [Burkholderia sp. MSMB1835]|uniref:hypothetical protein n=1 Tax=Burkholderia sp. MSMB1835 TaxID=1637876 RepID=UPI0012E37419|nr:hypothetical protein [Burkholderia sp. MSMB1835]